MVAHTVISVGPYALKKRRPLPHFAANSTRHASPATIKDSRDGRSVIANVPKIEGGTVSTLIRQSRSVRVKSAPVRTARRGGSTRVAPVKSVLKISETDASKESDANCRTRLVSVTSKRRA